MPDREKVINELRFQLDSKEVKEQHCSVQLSVSDAEKILSLLKEREPIEPIDDGHGSLICGNQGDGCGCVGSYNLKTKVVDKFCNFCPECGRRVKWNE